MPGHKAIDFKRGKKGRLHVTCCNQHNTSTEYLAVFYEGVAYVGAKRKITDQPAMNGEARSTSLDLTAPFKTINGVNWSCSACSNNSWFQCSCGAYSCDTSDKKHICPSCGKVTKPDQKIDIKSISASDTGSQKLALQNSTVKSISSGIQKLLSSK